MIEDSFINLIKELFEELDITDLYKVEIKPNGKIKVKYKSNYWGKDIMCKDTLTRNKE